MLIPVDDLPAIQLIRKLRCILSWRLNSLVRSTFREFCASTYQGEDEAGARASLKVTPLPDPCKVNRIRSDSLKCVRSDFHSNHEAAIEPDIYMKQSRTDSVLCR